MPAEDIRHPEKQPNSSKGGRKKYKGQKKRQKRVTWSLGFRGGSGVKNTPAVQETRVQSLSQEDPLEENMASHSNILAWRSPGTEAQDYSLLIAA